MLEEVDRLGSRGLSRSELFAQLRPRLHRILDYDAACWHSLDPRTLFMTNDAPDELVDEGFFTVDDLPDAAQRLVTSEYLIDDYVQWAALARQRTPVGTLGEATRGQPERSTDIRSCSNPSGCGTGGCSNGAARGRRVEHYRCAPARTDTGRLADSARVAAGWGC
jgi:hypothetical protein